MNSKPVVLVVDNDPQILESLYSSLSLQGYNVVIANNYQKVQEILEKSVINLIILEPNMPVASGLDFCKIIRNTSNAPIIFLSTTDKEENKVLALNSVADDYIVKPFSINELMARIRAILRRKNKNNTGNKILVVGSLRVDLDNSEILFGDNRVQLSPTELRLLKHLMNNAGKVMRYQVLLEAGWGVTPSQHIDCVRVYVNQIRNKIEIDKKNPRYIKTIHGVGYTFVD